METRSLNTLYKLLWEQINYDIYFECLCHQIKVLYNKDIITYTEESKLIVHMFENKPENTGDVFWWPKGTREDRKEFVQRMVKETENDN